VPCGHSLCRNSSRLTARPGSSSKVERILKDCPFSLTLARPFRSSYDWRLASKGPKRTTEGEPGLDEEHAGGPIGVVTSSYQTIALSYLCQESAQRASALTFLWLTVAYLN
jgi:hypothetical protein